MPTTKLNLYMILFLAHSTHSPSAQVANPTRPFYFKTINTQLMPALLLNQPGTHLRAFLTGMHKALLALGIAADTAQALHMLAKQYRVFGASIVASVAFNCLAAVSTEAAVEEDASETKPVRAFRWRLDLYLRNP